MYSFGKASHGRLGTGEVGDCVIEPAQLEALKNQKVI